MPSEISLMISLSRGEIDDSASFLLQIVSAFAKQKISQIEILVEDG